MSELYNLTADPRELNNLYEKSPGTNANTTDVQEKLLEHLLQWYVITTDVTPLKVDAAGLPPQSDSNALHGRHRALFWWEKTAPLLHPELKTGLLGLEEESSEHRA